MASVPKRVASRIAEGLKRFQPILASAKSRDVNESDTVLLISDLLQVVFGYDKYTELSSEHVVRGTYCDLAIKLDGQLSILIEVKAIGLDLKESYVKQAVDYAANQGCDWVALTNGVIWRVYKVAFTKPIQADLVVEFDLLALNPRKAEDIELIALLAKEGWQRAHLGEYHLQRQALNRFVVGALLVSDSTLDLLRREIRRVYPDVKVEADDLRKLLVEEVVKREVLEGDKADAARRQIGRAASRKLRAAAAAEDAVEPEPASPAPAPVPQK